MTTSTAKNRALRKARGAQSGGKPVKFTPVSFKELDITEPGTFHFDVSVLSDGAVDSLSEQARRHYPIHFAVDVPVEARRIRLGALIVNATRRAQARQTQATTVTPKAPTTPEVVEEPTITVSAKAAAVLAKLRETDAEKAKASRARHGKASRPAVTVEDGVPIIAVQVPSPLVTTKSATRPAGTRRDRSARTRVDNNGYTKPRTGTVDWSKQDAIRTGVRNPQIGDVPRGRVIAGTGKPKPKQK